MQPIADVIEDLTPDWLTDALRAGGLDLTVASLAADRIGDGQMGATYRLHLTYDGTDGPATLVAKLGNGDEAARAKVAHGYASEVGFYTEIADTVEVRTPRCWYGAINEASTQFTLVLDDVPGAAPLAQVDGCSVEQAHAAVANLTGLHAPRWNDDALLAHSFLMRPSEATASMIGHIFVPATDGFIARYEDHLQPDEVATLRAAAEVIGAWLVARPEPFTVLHGDYRLDNLLLVPSDDDVVAVDWQTAAIGPPLRDVAYFLGSSLDVELRRSHEEELVGSYHDGLTARGVSGYSSERCWGDYRLGHLQGPMVTILGCMYASAERSDRADAMFLAMTRRSCAAIADLRSLELL